MEDVTDGTDGEPTIISHHITLTECCILQILDLHFISHFAAGFCGD